MWVQELVQRGEIAALGARLGSLELEHLVQIIRELRLFSETSQAQIVDLLIEREELVEAIAAEIGNLRGVDRPSVGRKLLARGGGYAGSVALYPAAFQIDQLEIIDALVRAGPETSEYLAAYIDRFDPKHHLYAAVKLLLDDAASAVHLLMYLERFTGLGRGWLSVVLESAWPFRKQISRELERLRRNEGVLSAHHEGSVADESQFGKPDPEHDLAASRQLVARGYRNQVLGCLDMFHPTVRWEISQICSGVKGDAVGPPDWKDYDVMILPENVLSFSHGQAKSVVLEAAREMLVDRNEQGSQRLLEDFDISWPNFESFIRQSMGLDLREKATAPSASIHASRTDLYRILLDVVQEANRICDDTEKCELHDLGSALVRAAVTIPDNLRPACIHFLIDEIRFLNPDREVFDDGFSAVPDYSLQDSYPPTLSGSVSPPSSSPQEFASREYITHTFIESLINCRELVDLPIISHLVTAGYAQNILNNLESLSRSMPDKIPEICSIVASNEIRHGYFGRAAQILGDADISLGSFANYLADELYEHIRDNNHQALLSIAGWFSLHPELQSALDHTGILSSFESYLGLFAMTDVDSLTCLSVESVSHWKADVEQLVRQGLPLLETLGWLTPEHARATSEMLPLFLRQGASTGAAWNAHRANLQGGKAPFLRSVTDVRFELKLLLSFHRSFPFLRVPLMYQVYRTPPPVGWDIRSALETRVRDERHFYNTRVTISLQYRVEGKATHTPGSEQLTSILRKLLQTRQRELLEDDFHGETGLKDLQTELLAALIGSRDTQVIRRRIDFLGTSISSGIVEPKDSRFQPQRFSARRLDSEQLRAFEFSKDTQETYSRFLRAFNDVKGRSAEAVSLQGRRMALSLLSEREQQAQQRALSMEDARARAAIEVELRNLRATINALGEARDPVSILKALCDFGIKKRKARSEIAPIVQRIALPFVLRNMPSAEQFIDSLEPKPSKAALEWIRELVNRNLVEEALGPMRLSVEQAEVAVKCFGIGPLEHDAARLAAIGTRGAEVLVAHPSRGVLGELSGFNCQACWTRKENLMQQSPNVTAILFVRNPDNADRARLIGACMVIKALDLTGDEVFIIRGINPTQNFITHVSAESFFESFVDDALVPMAKAQGIGKILIPADGLFEAQTNRPSLHFYINERYASAPVVPLDRNGPQTTFNDLEIWDCCVLVRTLDPACTG